MTPPMKASRSTRLRCTVRFDQERRRLFVAGSDFDHDLIDVGELVRRHEIAIPDEVVYADRSDGTTWIIRHKPLRRLLTLWKVR